MRLKLREVAEAARHDPKKALMDSLGSSVDAIEVFHNQVLCATYIEPPRIMKGPNGEDILFHKTDKGQLEDRFQGKCALIVKMGPTAFKYDGTIPTCAYEGPIPQVGDWVIAYPSDGRELFSGNASGGTSCRLFDDRNIKGRVSDPALIY